MADQVKISELPEKTSINESDFLVGNVGSGSDATGRIGIAALRTRLNIGNQTIVGDVGLTGDITQVGDQNITGKVSATQFEGNGALITGIVSAGVGGTSSTSSLSLVCNSANGTPAAKIVGSKYSQDLFDVDENGFRVRTGIPYTHEDDAIPFNKDLDLQNKYLLRSQTINDLQPFPYYKGNGSSAKITFSSLTQFNPGLNDFSIRVVFYVTADDLTNNSCIFRIGATTPFIIFQCSSNKLRIRFNDGVDDIDIVSDANLTAEKIYNCVGLFDRDGNMSMVLNGVPQADVGSCPSASTTFATSLTLFANVSSAYLNGAILSKRWWNRLLTADEAKIQASNPLKAIDAKDEGASSVAQNVSSCVNNSYDTFSGASATGFHAESDGTGATSCGTATEITLRKGQSLILIYTHTQNSGVLPSVSLRTSFGGAAITEEGNQLVADGSNIIIMTPTVSGTGLVRWINADGDASNFDAASIDIHSLGCTFQAEGSDFDSDYMFDRQNSLVGAVTGAALYNRSRNLSPVYGTFTVSLVCGTSGTITLNSSKDSLQYSKIGKEVFITGFIEVSGISSPLGSLTLTGIPHDLLSTVETSDLIIFDVKAYTLQTSASGGLMGLMAASNEIRIIDGMNLTSTLTDDFANHIKVGTGLYISGKFTTSQ